MDQEKVGKFIAKLRKEQKLTQAELGEKLSVSDKTVSKWERGTRAPDISLLNDLSKILGVTTTELLNGNRISNITNEKIDNITFESIKYYTKLNKKIIIRRFYFIIIVILLIFLSILLSIFFNNNYDNCYVYTIESIDSEYLINGIMVDTEEKDIFSISSIENISNYELDNEKVFAYEYSLNIGDTEIYKIGNILLYEHNEKNISVLINDILNEIGIYIIEESNYNDIMQVENSKDEILLKMNYINQDLTNKKIEIPLSLSKVFANDKILYDGGKHY